MIYLGSTAMGDGGVDSVSTFEITDGTLIAIDNSIASPDSSSSQYSLYYTSSSTLPAGTVFHNEDSEGNKVLTFAPQTSYLNVMFSSDQLAADSEYQIFIGGTVS